MPLGRAKTRLIVVGTLLLLGAGYYAGRQLWAGYHYRQALDAGAQRDFAAADAHLLHVLDVWPNDPAVRLLAARTARRQGDMDRASPHLQVCTRQGASRDAVALEYRLWHLQSGELDEAPAFLQQTRDQPDAPDTPFIQEALIESCLSGLAAMGDMGLSTTEVAARPEWAWAREAIDAWLERRPGEADQVQSLVWRGRLHDLAGDHEQGVAELRQAIVRSPDRFEPRWRLVASIGQEAPAETAEHLAALAQRFPDNRRVRLMLALGRHGLGQLEEARQILDELLAANPKDVPVLIERGRLALDAGQPAQAERWLREAEAVAPDHADVLLSLSRTLTALDRAAQSQQYLERFRQAEAAQKRQRDERMAKVNSMRHNEKGP